MSGLYWAFLGLIIEEMVSLFFAIRNYRYARAKRRNGSPLSRPKVTLIVPCKGIDVGFRDCIASFYALEYDNYELRFVVSDTADPAYEQLLRLKQELTPRSQAKAVRVHVAGPPQGCSQKVHNLLFCCRQVCADTEALVFADCDVEVRRDWLAWLVWPLRGDRVGAATGYRWFVPERDNLASLALSAINGKVVQMMGNTRWNLIWGGSMAIRTDVFRRLRIDEIWTKSLSDDLTLSRAVKRGDLKVVFVPACIVPSHHSVTWGSLWEFGRRQFIITRWYSPGTWWLAMLGTVLSVVGLWTAIALTIWAAVSQWRVTLGSESWSAWPVWMAATGILLTSGFVKAFFRQQIAKAVPVPANRPLALRGACNADLTAFWLWPIITLALLLSSAFGRTILWRGIRYRFSGPMDVEVVPDPTEQDPLTRTGAGPGPRPG